MMTHNRSGLWLVLPFARTKIESLVKGKQDSECNLELFEDRDRKRSSRNSRGDYDTESRVNCFAIFEVKTVDKEVAKATSSQELLPLIAIQFWHTVTCGSFCYLRGQSSCQKSRQGHFSQPHRPRSLLIAELNLWNFSANVFVPETWNLKSSAFLW